MELPMSNVPFRIAKRMLRIALLNPAQTMQRRNYGNFPVVIAATNRAPNQLHLDQNSGVSNLHQVLMTNRCHAKPALLLGINQAFGGKRS